MEIARIREQMQQSLQAMEREYGTIRAGRPTQTLFANIMVSYHNTPTPLNQMATISIPDARQVIIKPWDMSSIEDIHKAILSSELSLNPTNDGKLIRITIPPLSEERRHEYVKIAKNIAEKSKISIRNIRRDANEALKHELKEKKITEDEERALLNEVQKLTDDIILKIEDRFSKKSKEILDN